MSGYNLIEKYEVNIINFELNKALEKVWFFINQLNQYIDKMEPWSTIKINKVKNLYLFSKLIICFF